jgi:dihydroorotase
MTAILLKGGRVIDPGSGFDQMADLLVKDGKIARIAPEITALDAEIVNLEGNVVSPGLVDVHTHLRDPGFTHREDFITGTRAAAAGGFTTLLAMPNTDPVCDSPVVVEYILSKAKRLGIVNVLPLASITVGQRGEKVSPLEALIEAGAVGFSDDGQPVTNSGVMRDALIRAKIIDKVLAVHCEDRTITRGGVINAGPVADRLNLKGIPYTSEAVMVARDILLAEETGAKVHICHVGCARSVELIREGKKRGIQVTGEVIPHYLNTTDEDMVPYDTRFKIKPPIGGRKDLEAIREGLADGTIEVIATDHAPYTPEEKSKPFGEDSPFGLITLETALGVVLTELVHGGVLPLARALATMTVNPARLFGLDKGTLEVGKDADIIVIDLNKKWKSDPDTYYSKSRNCPQHGRTFTGRAVLTMVGGRIVMRDGKIINR